MNDEWGTPKDLFDFLNKDYDFNLDAAASDINHKVDKYYTKENSALTQSWYGNVWLNPPYSRGLINEFVDKTIHEVVVAENADLVVLLTRLDPSTSWFKKLSMHGEFILLPKRLKFEGAKSSYPFPCCIWFIDSMYKINDEYKYLNYKGA